ncbi:MAG: ATP-binding protein [Halobacteriovoraceae bacterium]|nr:ATP-binding protein [Halobacteriovoraceae bacterium]
MKKEIKIAFQVKDNNLAKKLKKDKEIEDYKFILLDQIEIEKADFILIDANYLEKYKEGLLQLRRYPQKIILISNKKDEDNINLFLSQYPINHLVGFNSKAIIKEIYDTMLKCLTNPFWGIDRYLKANFLSQACRIKSSDEIETSVYKIIEQFNFSNTFKSSVDYLKLMANELITNAFFNTIDGNADRRQKVITEKNKKIIFTMGKDKHHIIFSIQDDYGLLTRDTIIQCLTRSFREKTPLKQKGGAGLGLYITFSYANQLIINSEKNKRTEVIIIIDCNRRYKKYKERITSLHFHEVI